MSKDTRPDADSTRPTVSGEDAERLSGEVPGETVKDEEPGAGEHAAAGIRVEQDSDSGASVVGELSPEARAEADRLISQMLGADGGSSGSNPGNDPAQGPSGPTIRPAVFEEFAPEPGGQSTVGGIDLLLDVPLSVTVELGKARCYVRDILNLTVGSVIELEKLAGDPVDVLVNGKPIARGEVVVLDENFGVRIQEIISSPRKNAKERSR